ncbi:MULTISPECIES: restriction endonuclease [unclassified Streptomyces]|uniref:restriction endonuclease n=1 Tax=unclassified Streptomyces TaxID=2593676 RepID=UPI003332713D
MTTTRPPTAEVEDDPEHHLDDVLPLDRRVHLELAAAVLNPPTDASTLRPVDCEQIALELAGHARVVADDVRRRCALLPARDPKRVLTEAVLGEADRRLSVRPLPTLPSAQNRARLVKTLYERLNSLPPVPTATPPP